MAVAYIQSANGTGVNEGTNTVTSCSATFNTTTTVAGRLIVVQINWNSATGSITSVTDNLGQTYTAVEALTQANGVSLAAYYFPNSAAGVSKVTVNFSAAVSYAECDITEVSGCDQSNPVAQHLTSVGTTGNASSGSITTTDANTILFTMCVSTGQPGTLPNTPNWTIFNTNIGNQRGLVLETAPGTFSANYTGSSGNWAANIVVFRAPVSAGQHATAAIQTAASVIPSAKVTTHPSDGIATGATVSAAPKAVLNATVSI